MTDAEIHVVIDAFGEAARRAAEAGADGIQLIAAHGYLLNQFISPFYNRRNDSWGGSDENRFRFLKKVIEACQQALPNGMPIMIKLNTIDYTPQDGVKIPLAVKYTRWLAELGIDCLEVSSGTLSYV